MWFVVSLLFCFVGCLRVSYCVLLICLLVVGYLFVLDVVLLVEDAV